MKIFNYQTVPKNCPGYDSNCDLGECNIIKNKIKKLLEDSGFREIGNNKKTFSFSEDSENNSFSNTKIHFNKDGKKLTLSSTQHKFYCSLGIYGDPSDENLVKELKEMQDNLYKTKGR